MALFDDDDEQSEDGTESSGWDTDDEASPAGEWESEVSGDRSGGSGHPDPAIGGDWEAPGDLETATIADGDPSGTLKRAVDPEAGVVVYAYKNGNAGGLSVVPLSDTDLAGDTE